MSDKDKLTRSLRDLYQELNTKAKSIPFDKIGDKIKSSVNSTISKIDESLKFKDLPQTRNPKVCAQKPPEKEKGILYTVFAIFGYIIGGSLSFIFFFEFFDYWNLVYILFFVLSILGTLIVPTILWKRGAYLKKLSNNYVRFLRELGTNTMIPIRDLASGVNQSEKETISDLVHMMKNGYFKQARIVEDGKFFILDIPTFKIYKQKLSELPSYQKKTLANHEEEEVELTAEDINAQRAMEIIEESLSSLDKLASLKKDIKNAEFKENIAKLVDNASDILKIIDKYPDKAYGLGKFSTYYLPTSIKLVDSYKDFEMLSLDDDAFSKSKEDINKSIKDIGEAFSNIKSDLLEDRTMDVKTEIDTISLLLNQEGYLGDDWRNTDE
ncbi:5-bromo-4-chloroindolyl phosphate hydrolysis family protein [Anaerococcus sp. AGMB09787]|uniref:5-bromo-4-chloroindolyl phosphate hydrolysis family protein n=1 Tax=Anaerococcus sp. AGMB09787 TaxID=2922869 RepID=UPI001FAEA04F|nr:5-bromo-4-chloroindolyl phosphate hydrolysis family protein [Anaerococcus sp. AGMB09787]